jgi:hypothetical protein
MPRAKFGAALPALGGARLELGILAPMDGVGPNHKLHSFEWSPESAGVYGTIRAETALTNGLGATPGSQGSRPSSFETFVGGKVNGVTFGLTSEHTFTEGQDLDWKASLGVGIVGASWSQDGLSIEGNAGPLGASTGTLGDPTMNNAAFTIGLEAGAGAIPWQGTRTVEAADDD